MWIYQRNLLFSLIFHFLTNNLFSPDSISTDRGTTSNGKEGILYVDNQKNEQQGNTVCLSRTV